MKIARSALRGGAGLARGHPTRRVIHRFKILAISRLTVGGEITLFFNRKGHKERGDLIKIFAPSAFFTVNSGNNTRKGDHRFDVVGPSRRLHQLRFYHHKQIEPAATGRFASTHHRWLSSRAYARSPAVVGVNPGKERTVADDYAVRLDMQRARQTDR